MYTSVMFGPWRRVRADLHGHGVGRGSFRYAGCVDHRAGAAGTRRPVELVAEGRHATRDIAGLALRVLLPEGNAVAALCAAANFAALLLGRRDDDEQ
ncbi:unnamed protein product [Urochloa humidicola]